MPASRRDLIRFAEYVAVSASVIGVIATLSTRQPAYAVAPLSASVALNLVSRRQQSESLNATAADIAQQSKKLALKVQQASDRLDTIAKQGVSHQQGIEALNRTCSEQSSEVIATAQTIASIREDIDRQQKQLANLAKDRSADELTTESEQIEAQMNTAVQGFQSVLRDLSARIDTALGQQNEYIAQAKQQAAITQQSAQSTSQLESCITNLYSDFEEFKKIFTG